MNKNGLRIYKHIMDIKNIIFDLGGVVIDLRRRDAIDALDRLGISDASSLLGEYAQKGPFLDLETGKVSEAELYDMLLPYCKKETRCSDIRDAFEEFLKELPIERLEYISRLRGKGYKVFVLSNTNPIMYNHWIDNAFRAQGKTINDYFDGITVSFQEGTCKPDPQIFRNVILRYGLNPSETLMLDDSEANCEAARSVGLQAIRILPDGTDSFNDVCEKLLKKGGEK